MHRTAPHQQTDKTSAFIQVPWKVSFSHDHIRKETSLSHARLGATILLYKWKLLCSHDKCPGQKTALCCGQLWETFTKHCLWSSEKLANSGLMILATVIFDTYKCLGVWVNDKLFIMCTLLIFPGSSQRRFLFDESKLLYSFF